MPWTRVALFCIPVLFEKRTYRSRCRHYCPLSTVFNHATVRVVQVRRSWFIFCSVLSDIFTLKRNNTVVSYIFGIQVQYKARFFRLLKPSFLHFLHLKRGDRRTEFERKKPGRTYSIPTPENSPFAEIAQGCHKLWCGLR
jgi:hypothetical protein